MITEVKTLRAESTVYTVEIKDTELGVKQFSFIMPFFNQAAFERIIKKLHSDWTVKGNTGPGALPTVNAADLRDLPELPVKLPSPLVETVSSVIMEPTPESIDETDSEA